MAVLKGISNIRGVGVYQLAETGEQALVPEFDCSIILPVRDKNVDLAVMLRLLLCNSLSTHEIIVICEKSDSQIIESVKGLDRPTVVCLTTDSPMIVSECIKLGCQNARGEFVMVVCSDNVGPVILLDEFLEVARTGADFVNSSRYIRGGRRLGGAFTESWLSIAGNTALRRVLGGSLTDYTSGIKLFRRECFSLIEPARLAGWAAVLDMAIKAEKKGLRLAEMPVTAIDKLYGGMIDFDFHGPLGEYARLFLTEMICWKRGRARSSQVSEAAK